jgi:hypothetical protein
MTTHIAFWLGAVAGGTCMSIVLLLILALQERYWSRKLARQAEHGVDIVLPTGRRGQLLLAPEAAAQ